VASGHRSLDLCPEQVAQAEVDGGEVGDLHAV
jgi:hypothetical protein